MRCALSILFVLAGLCIGNKVSNFQGVAGISFVGSAGAQALDIQHPAAASPGPLVVGGGLQITGGGATVIGGQQVYGYSYFSADASDSPTGIIGAYFNSTNDGPSGSQGIKFTYTTHASAAAGFDTGMTSIYFAAGTTTQLNNPFSTRRGSNEVIVGLRGHGQQVGQRITFDKSSLVGGINLNGTFTISKIIDDDHFTIQASADATATTDNGGGKVTAAYFRGPYPSMLGRWTALVTPDDPVTGVNQTVEEMNVVNRGPDQGWTNDRSTIGSTGFLVLTPDVNNYGTSGDGHNVTYGIDFTQSPVPAASGDYVHMYNAMLVEPNSIAPGTGRGIYETGDSMIVRNKCSTEAGSPLVEIDVAPLKAHGLAVGDQVAISNATPLASLDINGTFTVKRVDGPGKFTISASTAARSTVQSGGGIISIVRLDKLPYSPLEFGGGWRHGVRLLSSTFADGYALLLNTSHMIGWTGEQQDGTGPVKAATIGARATPDGIGLTLSPSGAAEIRLNGPTSVTGPLSKGVEIIAERQTKIMVAGAAADYAGTTPILILTAPATIASYSVRLPLSNSIKDGQVIRIVSTAMVGRFRLLPQFGQTIFGAPDTIGPNSPLAFMWDQSQSAWIRIT